MPKLFHLVSSLMGLAAASAAHPGAVRDATAGGSPGRYSPPIVAIAQNDSPALSIDRSADGLFYVDAQVNGTFVHFVVDSGSSVVVLSAADAARAAVGGREGVNVDTAGGASSMRRAQIRRVVFAGKTLSDVDAAIVNRNLKVSLLGQSALSQLASVRFSGDHLNVY